MPPSTTPHMPGTSGSTSVHDVARGGAHDGDHLARLDGPAAGAADVGVDVADGDGDALGQPGPGGRLGGQPPASPSGRSWCSSLSSRSPRTAVRARRGSPGRGSAVLVDALVAGRAGVADVGAAQLPDDPVGGLDPVVHRGVDLRVLLEELQALGELPLGGDQPAVARQPRLAALGGQGVDPVGLRLRGVVLPQLDVGVRTSGNSWQLAQRGAVGQGRAPSCTR